MTCFAATPGSRLISYEDESQLLPIVGWFHKGDGPGVLPLVLGRSGPLVTGDAILADSGRVFDLTTATFYSDAASWREVITKLDLYRPGLTSPALAIGGPAPVPPPGTPVINAAGKPVVDFSGKPFSKQSFWQAPANNPTVVFIVEPGTPSPISGALKITRDTFLEHKKTLPEVDVSALKPTEPMPELLAAMMAPPVPAKPKAAEKPAAPPPAVEDDADDMI